MASVPLHLPPHPTPGASQRDWYRTASLTLAWATVLGVAAAGINAAIGLSGWFTRASLTLAGLALASHVALSLALSRPPRLET